MPRLDCVTGEIKNGICFHFCNQMPDEDSARED
jgi:hypothetical protein